MLIFNCFLRGECDGRCYLGDGEVYYLLPGLIAARHSVSIFFTVCQADKVIQELVLIKTLSC